MTQSSSESTMNDPRRVRLVGRGVVIRGNDIDTDRIIPARFLRCVTFEGLGAHAFEDDRAQARAAGQTHPLDAPHFASARALIVNDNFGCGSSREHAPQSLIRWGQGIEFIVGQSFAEIFFGNCVSLGVSCVTVDEPDMARLMVVVEADPTMQLELDLVARRLRADQLDIQVKLADGPRERLTSGRWDSTAELLAGTKRIRDTIDRLPYTSFSR